MIYQASQALNRGRWYKVSPTESFFDGRQHVERALRVGDFEHFNVIEHGDNDFSAFIEDVPHFGHGILGAGERLNGSVLGDVVDV